MTDVTKEWGQACLKNVSTKCLYKSYIFNMYVKTRFGIK